MNYTENYQLNQWVESDRVLREDFNADNQKIETAIQEVREVAESKSDIVFGSYVGDGTQHRTIDLGFPIKWIFVYPASDDPNSKTLALAAPGFPPPVATSNTPRLSVVGTGIQVGFASSSGPYTNSLNKTFYYIAAKT